MKRILPWMICLPLLTGCTDIRTRLLPDILAVNLSAPVQFAAHTSQDTGIITAQAETVLQMPDALRYASGAEISTGHLTMLAVSGNPCGVLEAFFQAQMLAPTCMVLSVPADACGQLEQGRLPKPEQLQAAVDTGLLPSRTADAVLADLRGGSGVTAVCTACSGGLTLAIWSDGGCCGILSDDAARGLALLGKRRKSFDFAAESITYSVRSDTLQIQVSGDDVLHIGISGTVCTAPPLNDAAAARLTDMLTAAVTETALSRGADLLFLREQAIRAGIASARFCSQEEWHDLLCSADCSITLNLQKSPEYDAFAP